MASKTRAQNLATIAAAVSNLSPAEQLEVQKARAAFGLGPPIPTSHRPKFRVGDASTVLTGPHVKTYTATVDGEKHTYRMLGEAPSIDDPEVLEYTSTVAGKTARSVVDKPGKVAKVEKQAERGIRGVWDSFRALGNGAARRIERVPTLGDIGVPLTILLVLFFAIMPTKGADGKIHTRLGWLWLTIINQAHVLEPSAVGTTTGATGGGVSTSSGSDNVSGAGGVIGAGAASSAHNPPGNVAMRLPPVGVMGNPLQVALAPIPGLTTNAGVGTTGASAPAAGVGGGGGANGGVYAGLQHGNYGKMLFDMEMGGA